MTVEIVVGPFEDEDDAEPFLRDLEYYVREQAVEIRDVDEDGDSL